MTQKTRKLCTYWSPLYNGKPFLKNKGGNIWISNIWKYFTTEITRMQTFFLVLKHQKNMHIKFLSISEVPAGKRPDFISNWGKPFTHRSEMVSTRDRLHNSSFFKINTLTNHIDFALFINNGGRTWKTSDSNTISTSSSASASASAVFADWDVAPPLQNVRVDTQYVR